MAVWAAPEDWTPPEEGCWEDSSSEVQQTEGTGEGLQRVAGKTELVVSVDQ